MLLKDVCLLLIAGAHHKRFFPTGLKHCTPVAPTGLFCRPLTKVNLKDELNLSHSAREQVMVTIDE